jgi:hypothetical protein
VLGVDKTVFFAKGFLFSKIFGINAPSAKQAVEQHHDGKDISELGWDFGQEIFVEQQVCAKKGKKYCHRYAHNEHRVAKAATVADAVVS